MLRHMDSAYTGRGTVARCRLSGPAGRLLRPATIVLAVLAGLAIGFGAADVARSGGFGSWLARHGLPPPYLPAGRAL